MLGCDLHCSYCQNWVTSQALRDPQAVSPPLDADPRMLVEEALRLGGRVVVSTYNEPLITSEWAVEIFKHARAAGLMTAYVSNGNGTPRVLEFLRPWIDLYKVDLKSFDDKHYRQLGGRLEPILQTIRALHQMGIWVEIVTLLIPGFNDAPEELTRLTAFLASVSPDIPWHVTAFHKDYRMSDPENTTPEMLMAAADIGKRNGLRYVYAGNLPGCVGISNTPTAIPVARAWSSGTATSSRATGSRRMARARSAGPRFRAGGERRSTGRSRPRRSCQAGGASGRCDQRWLLPREDFVDRRLERLVRLRPLHDLRHGDFRVAGRTAQQEHRRAGDVQLRDALDAGLHFPRVLARFQAGAERRGIEAGVSGDGVSCSTVLSGASNSLVCRSQNLP